VVLEFKNRENLGDDIMKFIERNKHCLIEKQTMELATYWYYRYLEKEEQIEKIEQQLIEFENKLHEFMSKANIVSVEEVQKAWNKTVYF